MPYIMFILIMYCSVLNVHVCMLDSIGKYTLRKTIITVVIFVMTIIHINNNNLYSLHKNMYMKHINI